MRSKSVEKQVWIFNVGLNFRPREWVFGITLHFPEAALHDYGYVSVGFGPLELWVDKEAE